METESMTDALAPGEHIVKAYGDEIKQLKETISALRNELEIKNGK